MDIQAILKQFGPALTQQLTSKSGFTGQQAQGFLGALLPGILSAVKGGGLNLQSLLGGDASSLLSKLDLGGMAKSAGIDKAKAEAGAKEVVPGLLKQLQSQSGGLEGLLGKVGGAGGAQDLLKKAGKLLGN